MGVFCINTKSKDFLNTAKRLDIHPDSLEVYVHLYLNQAASTNYMEATDELPFPSDDEIREYFSLGNRESGTQAIDAWVKRYGATDGFVSDSEVNEAIRLYGTGNVHTYMNYAGNIVHRVSRPNITNKKTLKYFLTNLNIIDNRGNLLGISRKKFYDRMKNLAIPAELYMPFDKELVKQVSLVFERNPQLSEIGTEELYIQYLATTIGDFDIVNSLLPNNILASLFNVDGTINWETFESLTNTYYDKLADSMFSHGRYTLATRPENHFTGEKNTLNHIKFVTQSMLDLLKGKFDKDLPFVSEARASLRNQRDLMVLAAMFHDVAKPYRHGDIHGWESADILRDIIGLNYNNRLAEWAVRHHMPMPFAHKAEFSLSNPDALEVAKNIARDARRVGIDAATAINAFVLINAADIINGRELNVDDNWAKKAMAEGPSKYGNDISVKNVLSIELKEKVDLLKKAFKEIENEDFGNTVFNYTNQQRFDYVEFPEGGRKDGRLPYLSNTTNVFLPGSTEDVNQFTEFVGNTLTSPQYTQEMQDIKAKAIADGTFMKAPNGKPTNLTERQWLQVRTKNFINWFGDWEKYAPKSDATDRLLSKLNSIANSNSKFASLAKLILDNKALPYNLKYFKIDNNRDDIEGHSAMWHSVVNLIEVLGNNVSEEEINKALLHELIHYNTEELLTAYKNSPENVPQNIRQNVIELYSIIDYAKKYITEHFDEKKFREIAERQNKNIGSRVFYAFDNQGDVEIDEFISEIFTNPGLQEVLNEIPYKETKQTLWDRIKECIQNIFGLPINKGSVLDEALKVSTEFITKTNENYNSVSKVVDENGEPLVVYRGTTFSDTLKVFTPQTSFFTENKKEAEEYGEKFRHPLDNSPLVIPVFLNIRNPHEYDAEGKEYKNVNGGNFVDFDDFLTNHPEYEKEGWYWKYQVGEEGIEIPQKVLDEYHKVNTSKTVRTYVSENIGKNNDGVIVKNVLDPADGNTSKTVPITDYIPNSSNQIKSATANSGEFAEDNDNIYYQKSILTELSKLRQLNQPLGKAGSQKKMRERLKNANLNPIIVNTIMKAVELDNSLAGLTPLQIFNLVTRQQEKGLAQQYNEYLQKPIDKALEEHLLKFLEPFHVTSIEEDLMATHGVTGIYDIINKIIHLAKAEDRNSITVTEEVAHAIVELLGAKKSRKEENKDYTFLFDNIESTDIYK